MRLPVCGVMLALEQTMLTALAGTLLDTGRVDQPKEDVTKNRNG